MQLSVQTSLSNVQLELLKIFSHQLSENDLAELKQVLVHFFAQKLIKQADKVWEEQQWTDEKVATLLHTKMRKNSEIK